MKWCQEAYREAKIRSQQAMMVARRQSSHHNQAVIDDDAILEPRPSIVRQLKECREDKVVTCTSSDGPGDFGLKFRQSTDWA